MKKIVKKIFSSKNLKRALTGLAYYAKPGLTRSQYLTLNRIFTDTNDLDNKKVQAKIIPSRKVS